MSEHFVKGNDLLIVPNKCGSLTAQTVLKKQRIDQAAARESAATCNLYCVTRDPVSLFVSGWRYQYYKWDVKLGSRNGDVIKYIYSPEAIFVDFDVHIERCLAHSQTQIETEADWFFRRHSYWGPVNTASEYADPKAFTYIKLEKDFKKYLEHFKGKTLKRVCKHNRSEFQPWPVLKPNTIEIMRELDTWSEQTGYDFKKSVEQYQNR